MVITIIYIFATELQQWQLKVFNSQKKICMKHLKKISCFLAAGVLGLSSCEKEKDTTAPTFSIQSLSPATTTDIVCGEAASNVIPILSGQNLSFEFKLTDNEALGQYKIDIHDDFDCHGHEGERSPVPTVWSVQDVVNVSGTEQTISRSLQVPSDVMAGNYHFQIKVLDAEGNENTQTPIYTLKIRNSSDLVDPTFVQLDAVPTTINKGQTITISGIAGDNMDLENGKIELNYHDPSDEHHTAQTFTFPAGVGTEENFSLSFAIPSSFASGLYEFEIKLYDNVGNIIEQAFEVQIQ